MNACDSRPWTVQLDSGLRLQLPPSLSSLSTYVALEQERWFEPEISLVRHLMQPGQDALDIGANHGFYALEMARCGPDSHVWAFEPTQAPRRLLTGSVRENGFEERITVVPAGLAERDCEADFNVSEHSEFNQRGGGTGAVERVQLFALDGFLERHAPGRRIGFVKLDVEGEEPRIIAGGRHFFAEQQPVVVFELKHDAHVNLALLQQWRALGYGLFRWSASLSLLLPFDEREDELAWALNLVAVAPRSQADLAGRGLLLTAEAMRSAPAPVVGLEALSTWCSTPALAGLGRPDVAAVKASRWLQAVAAVAAAHGQAGLSPVERVALMLAANDKLDERDARPEELVLRVHVLHALGRPSAALDLARGVLRHWQPGAMGAGSGLPLVPPERADLRLVPHGTQRDWLRQRLAEYVARRSAWSSRLQQGSADAWATLMSDPDRSPESEQRYLLKHLLADSVPSISALRWLPDPAYTANPAIWRALIDTSRTLGPATAVAATASPGGAAKTTRPHTGSPLASPGVLTDFTVLFDLPNTLLRT
jgi:FkbM family methyltransferase